MFDNWRYIVTTLFFDVPKSKQVLRDGHGGLTKAQRENMDYFERFLTKIVEDKFSIVEQMDLDGREGGIDL